MRFVAVLVGLLWSNSAHAIFGTELGPLLQLVGGQVQEIEKLTQTLGVAQEQRDLLVSLNHGIDRTVAQIHSIQAIIEHTQGLDPSSVRSIADLNDFLGRAGEAKRKVEDLLSARVAAANLAIGQTAIQSDTAYRMGQEMVVVGAQLAQESQTASPGRAQQIGAASDSAQMLAQGVQLQTLAQIAQIQAISLELQKSQLEQMNEENQARSAFFQMQVQGPKRKKP